MKIRSFIVREISHYEIAQRYIVEHFVVVVQKEKGYKRVSEAKTDYVFLKDCKLN